MSDDELRKALAGASRERLEFIHAWLLGYLQALIDTGAGPLQPEDAPALAAAVERWLGEDGPNE